MHKPPHPVLEVASLFLRLGFTAFGGPAAHIAMYHKEVVVRRKWLTEEEFLDLLGATNLIPGPNSTEMVIHIGLRRAGWAGFALSGLCFVTPAMLIVLALAWAYVQFGTTPQASWLLYGVKPVVLLIILQAVFSLGKKAIKNQATAAAAVLAVGMYLAGANPLAALLLSALLAVLVSAAKLIAARRPPAGSAGLSGLLAAPKLLLPAALAVPAVVMLPFSLSLLFWTFLKIGAVLYGSGYVLVAFLHADFVASLGWLSDQQLLDAIAIGQFTPGPLFTAATFIGYLLGGVPGALLATLGIFLPSFFFVALSSPLIPRLRANPWTAVLLDGVNAASLGMMAAVCWDIGREALVDPFSFLILAGCAIALFRYKISTTWLILAGALLGLLSNYLR